MDGEGHLQGLPLAGVGDVVVIKGQIGIITALYGLGDVTHKCVEGLGALNKAHGKYKLRVLLIIHLDGDVVLGKHVAGAEPELEGVSKVDWHGDVGGKAIFYGGLNGGLGGQDPGGTGEVDRHRVDVYTGDGESQPIQHVFGIERGIFGSFDEMCDRLGDESPGAAGRVEDVLVQGIGHHLPHDGSSQPVGGVVLSQLATLVGWNDSLVEDSGNVRWGLLPVEPGDAAGQGPEKRQAAHLHRPGEEVRFDDTLQTGLVAEVTAMKQVGGIGLGQPVDITAEGRLHHHADDGGQVGMTDEQVIQLSGSAGDFAQGRCEQVLPKLPLDLDGAGTGVLVV